MILGKLKEKQETSQERSVTMVPEPRNTNRSDWFPAQLRAITERKPTYLSLFSNLRQASFLPSPPRSFQTRYQSRSHDSIQVSTYRHPLLQVFRSRSQSKSHSKCYEEGFLFQFCDIEIWRIVPRKLANEGQGTNQCRAGIRKWLRTS
jgi:hypothetical protein